MVARMVMRDEDFGATLTRVEAGGGLGSPSLLELAGEPYDWRSLYEQALVRAHMEWARAEAAQARCQQLRCAERTARSRAGMLKWNLDKSRGQLEAAFEEVRKVRRAARGALISQAEVARLERLLSEAGVDTRKHSTILSLRREVFRLRQALVQAKGTIASLRRRNARLRTKARKLQTGRVARVSREEALQAQIEKLRSTRSVLSKALFASHSEQQDKPGMGRQRGQQVGAPGHGRTPRCGLREIKQRRNPPKDARVCSRCSKPYVANGKRSTSLVEIRVKAHIRRIERTRWRRGCGCASSPREVTAPPAPRLFPGTLYGTSVWVRFLFEHCACLRPLSRVSAWFAHQGLPISPGTLADRLKHFVSLFGPLHEAILAHQNRTGVRHADETGWRVQEFCERGRSSRAWLWTSVSSDAVYFHIDPSRSAEVAKALFGDTACPLVLVCDRLSTYKRLARELDGKIMLQWCWAHQRRSFIECAAGHVRLTRWCQGWMERIATIFRLHEQRRKHHVPGLERQTPEFDAAQAALGVALARLFADAEAELAGLSDRTRKAKPLRSLLRHRQGLCVFANAPEVPPTNNAAERALRGPVIGRRLTFGSNSEKGAQFTAIMHSVVGTLSMNGVDVLRWLEAWLSVCAQQGGKAPRDLSSWLPWSMSEERKHSLMAPG